MQLLQLNQSYLLLTPLYIDKLLIFNKLCTSSNPQGQLRDLVFHFSHRGSHFWNVTLDHSQNWQSDLNFNIFWSSDNCVSADARFS